jgi:HD superfamily phosphodiesterase
MQARAMPAIKNKNQSKCGYPAKKSLLELTICFFDVMSNPQCCRVGIVIMLENNFIDETFHLSKIDPAHQDLFKAASPYLETRQNLIHTFSVYQYASLLLKHEPGAPEIVLPACILHDVGWSAISEADQLKAFKPGTRDEDLRRKHETEGVFIAIDIMRGLDYPDPRIKAITSIIDGHDTTPGARSLEDAVVKDADKLWRYSKVGFGIDIERFKFLPKRHFDYLVGHIDKWFLTRKGRAIAIHEAHQLELAYGLRCGPAMPSSQDPP